MTETAGTVQQVNFKRKHCQKVSVLWFNVVEWDIGVGVIKRRRNIQFRLFWSFESQWEHARGSKERAFPVASVVHEGQVAGSPNLKFENFLEF